MITICTDLRLPEASEAVKVRLKNQKIKKSKISCCFDSQSAERLRESTEGSDLSRSEMKSRQNPSPIGDRILSRSEMRGRDLASIRIEASYLRNRLTETDGRLEESKKINDAILSYEKMNDTAYFNQSTLSDESKDESNAFLSDSKDESEDAVFNESFRFTNDNSQLWKILGRSGSEMWDESTDESEDPSVILSGENEDGSESFESANESHNPCNESNINRVMDDFKSEVMGELLEIKRELKKKDDMNFHELLEIKREMKKKDNFKSEVMGELLEIKRELKGHSPLRKRPRKVSERRQQDASNGIQQQKPPPRDRDQHGENNNNNKNRKKSRTR